jgi:hypothetical protein
MCFVLFCFGCFYYLIRMGVCGCLPIWGSQFQTYTFFRAKVSREKKELFANTSKKMKGMMVSYGSYMGKQAEVEVPKLQSRVQLQSRARCILHSITPLPRLLPKAFCFFDGPRVREKVCKARRLQPPLAISARTFGEALPRPRITPRDATSPPIASPRLLYFRAPFHRAICLGRLQRKRHFSIPSRCVTHLI